MEKKLNLLCIQKSIQYTDCIKKNLSVYSLYIENIFYVQTVYRFFSSVYSLYLEKFISVSSLYTEKLNSVYSL